MAKKTKAQKTHEEAVRRAEKPPRRPTVDEQIKMLTSLPEEDVEQMMKEHEANRESPDTPIRQKEEEPNLLKDPLDIRRDSPNERDIPEPPKGNTDSQNVTEEPQREQVQDSPFFGMGDSGESRMSESFSELTVREADLSNLFDDGDDVKDILTDIRELLRDIPVRIAEELRNG